MTALITLYVYIVPSEYIKMSFVNTELRNKNGVQRRHMELSSRDQGDAAAGGFSPHGALKCRLLFRFLCVVICLTVSHSVSQAGPELRT